MESYKNVVITGASSGIGRALALECAVPSVTLYLLGRNSERLLETAEACRAKGAHVRISVVDIRDADALARDLTLFDNGHPVDLLIANAGVSAGLEIGRMPEAGGVSRRLMEVNYGGMLNTVEPLLPRFIERRRGRIVLISSLAALRPQPDLPSYSASKMAVRGYGIALRGWLSAYDVGVSLVYPGFVTSPMSARHSGLKPLEISAEKAARLIMHHLRRGRKVIAFPFMLALGAYLNMMLPAWASDLTNRPFRAEVSPDGET